MKFKPGDQVRFLNEVGEGTVKFIRDNKIFVETPDGFEIPFKESELVPGKNMYNQETEKKTIDSEGLSSSNSRQKKPVQTKRMETGVQKPHLEPVPISGLIYLAVVPTNPFSVSVSDFSLYLINDSDWEVLFTVSTISGKKLTPVAHGILEKDVKWLLDTFSQTRISKENLKVQLIFRQDNTHPFQAPETIDIMLTATAFYKQKTFSESDFFEEVSHLVIVADTNIRQPERKLNLDQLKEMMEEKNPHNSAIRPENKEVSDPDTIQVDLHIHELMEDSAGLQAHEMLKIQMDKFVKSLDEAVLNRTKRIIFIHGIGNGRLKFEIRKKLDIDYPNLKYQDASFQEYGFGATLVFTA